MEDPNKPPDVWAHKTLIYELDRFLTVGQLGYMRAKRQFGSRLASRENAGIGVGLAVDNVQIGILYPNHFLNDDEEDVTIAGYCECFILVFYVRSDRS